MKSPDWLRGEHAHKRNGIHDDDDAEIDQNNLAPLTFSKYLNFSLNTPE